MRPSEGPKLLGDRIVDALNEARRFPCPHCGVQVEIDKNSFPPNIISTIVTRTTTGVQSIFHIKFTDPDCENIFWLKLTVDNLNDTFTLVPVAEKQLPTSAPAAPRTGDAIPPKGPPPGSVDAHQILPSDAGVRAASPIPAGREGGPALQATAAYETVSVPPAAPAEQPAHKTLGPGGAVPAPHRGETRKAEPPTASDIHRRPTQMSDRGKKDAERPTLVPDQRHFKTAILSQAKGFRVRPPMSRRRKIAYAVGIGAAVAAAVGGIMSLSGRHERGAETRESAAATLPTAPVDMSGRVRIITCAIERIARAYGDAEYKPVCMGIDEGEEVALSTGSKNTNIAGGTYPDAVIIVMRAKVRLCDAKIPFSASAGQPEPQQLPCK